MMQALGMASKNRTGSPVCGDPAAIGANAPMETADVLRKTSRHIRHSAQMCHDT
jgi:hypothetical protein